MKIIIDFEAVTTRQYKIKKFNGILSVPYCFSMIDIDDKSHEVTTVFLDLSVETKETLFKKIKREIWRFIKNHDPKIRTIFDVSFYCFGDSLERFVLNEAFGHTKMDIVDLFHPTKVALNKIVDAIKKRKNSFEKYDKKINAIIIKNDEDKKKDYFNKNGLKSSGSKASFLGYSIFLHQEKLTKNRFYIQGLSDVEFVKEYLGEYNKQDVQDVLFVYENLEKVTKICEGINDERRKIRHVSSILAKLETVTRYVEEKNKSSYIGQLSSLKKNIEKDLVKQESALENYFKNIKF